MIQVKTKIQAQPQSVAESGAPDAPSWLLPWQVVWETAAPVLAQASAPSDPPAEPPAEPSPEPSADPGSAPGSAGGAEPGSEPSTEPPAEPAAAPAEDWRDKRIKQLTARLREEQRQKAAAPPTADPGSGSEPGGEAATQAEINRLANERATAIASEAEFNRRCDEAAQAGASQFSDFGARVAQLQSLVAGGDASELLRFNQLLYAALETGEAPRLLHQLGGDLNEAARLLSLAPVKMGIEMARLAAKPAQQISGAPRPIRPVSQTGGSHTAISPDDPERADRLTTREWMQRREAQLAAVGDRRRA